MEKDFLSVPYISLAGAVIIISIWLARLLFKKTPKVMYYALWAGVVMIVSIVGFTVNRANATGETLDRRPMTMAEIQTQRLSQHLLDFAEIPRGEDLRGQEYSGDWDGDGKNDRAYFSQESAQTTGYDYRNRAVVDFGNGEHIVAVSDELEQMSTWGGRFLIESADLNGDRQNEILLLIDLGGQGGHGSFGLYPYTRTKNGWELMNAPHHGFSLGLDYKDGKVTVTSGDYVETVADDAMLSAHYAVLGSESEWERVKSKEYHEANAADPICDIAVKEEAGKTIVKISQYVTGITGSHADGFGYLETTLSWKTDGAYSVDDMCFVLMPQ